MNEPTSRHFKLNEPNIDLPTADGCPFCGRADDLYLTDLDCMGRHIDSWVQCSCGATGPVSDMGAGRAVELWNQRKP